MNGLTRRGFLAGAFATLGAAGAWPRVFADSGGAEIDPSKAVVISDVHIPLPWGEQKYRTGMEYPWIIPQVKRFVGEILAMRPRPAYVFCLGDVSIAFSEEREYEIAAGLFRPLADAGIKLVFTVGNHDLREPFMQHLGQWTAGPSPVPGRIVSITHLPDFDLVLLDTLKEPSREKRGKYDALTSCELGEAQKKWLAEILAAATRPVLVAAHHTAHQAGLVKTVVRSPMVYGYLHGHNHKWDRAYLFDGYVRPTVVRSQGIPSFGIDRDVGYAILRSFPDRAELTYAARDYYFPKPLEDAARPPLWDDIVRDNASRRVVFPFRK